MHKKFFSHNNCIYISAILLFLFLSNIKAQSYSEKQIDSLVETANSMYNSFPQRALLLAQKTLKSSETQNYKKGYLGSLEIFSASYVRMGDLHKALDYCLLQEKEALESKDYLYYCSALRIKAFIYGKLGFYKEAEKTVKKGLAYSDRISKTDDMHRMRGLLYQVYGHLSYLRDGRKSDKIFLSMQKKSLEETLNIQNVEQTDPKKLISPYVYVAVGYNNLNKQDSALLCLNKALPIARKYQDLYHESRILFELGRIYILRKEYSRAEKYFTQSHIKNMQTTGDPYIKVSIYAYLYECNKALKNKTREEYFSKKYFVLQDSLSNIEKASVEIPMKDVVKEKDEDIIKQKDKLFIIISISILLTIIFLYFIYRYMKYYRQEKKQKDKIKIHLTEKEDQLSIMQLKINDGFEEVLDLAKNDDPSFLVRFKEVYPDFYEKLISAYPDLTISQLRFCAVLKLNFSTKEIAHYHHMTISGVKIKKNRLRKQLNIPSDIDLNKWMMDL